MSVHQLLCRDSSDLSFLDDNSVDLVVTSPPYPMVSMWDEMFFSTFPLCQKWLEEGDYHLVFDFMHSVLNTVWYQCIRVVKPGGFICINIGDAVRTLQGEFHLFPNHVKVMEYFMENGLMPLPSILWHKPNNSPTKFMGSGMYPAGAYVTYEHEYILVFRKGGKRAFTKEQMMNRKCSAYFWEERNLWFSDSWNISGVRQSDINLNSRKRNASFPLDIPYRLISMYSVQGDTVLDPFMGLGTTVMASMALNRNSIGIELQPDILKSAVSNIRRSMHVLMSCSSDRLERHKQFIDSLPVAKKEKLKWNDWHKVHVVSKQEAQIRLPFLDSVVFDNNMFECSYRDML